MPRSAGDAHGCANAVGAWMRRSGDAHERLQRERRKSSEFVGAAGSSSLNHVPAVLEPPQGNYTNDRYVVIPARN